MVFILIVPGLALGSVKLGESGTFAPYAALRELPAYPSKIRSEGSLPQVDNLAAGETDHVRLERLGDVQEQHIHGANICDPLAFAKRQNVSANPSLLSVNHP